jgi:hypothetical protein
VGVRNSGVMKAAVMYEGMTGNTRALAGKIGDELRSRGVEATVCPITSIDLQAVSDADIVFVGSWTDGLFLVGQRPGRAGRIQTMPTLAGKKTVVFCTYALHPGKVVAKLSALVAYRGAEVIGGMAVRRDDLTQGAIDIVEGTLAAVSV